MIVRALVLMLLFAPLSFAEEIAPLKLLKGFKLGQSLQELRAIGVRTDEWITAGDPKIPGPGEWGICKVSGKSSGTHFEFQMKDQKISFGQFSFAGDAIEKEVIALLTKKYGKLTAKKGESILGPATTYRCSKGVLEVKRYTLDKEFAEKRKSKVWMTVTIGKDGRGQGPE